MNRSQARHLALVFLLVLIATGAAAALPAAAAAVSGEVVWASVLNPVTVADHLSDGARGPDGSLYVCGRQGPPEACDMWIAKYTADGVIAWSRTWDGPDGRSDVPHGIAVDGHGNAFVCGSTGRVMGAADSIVLRYDAGGTLRWESRYDPFESHDGADAIALDADGRVFVIGWAETPDSTVDAYTARLRPSSGTRVWTSWYSAQGNASTWALAVTGSGTTYAAGASDTASGNTNGLLIKTTADGHRAWAKRWDGPEGLQDDWESVALGRSGNVYVAGDCDYLGDSDMALAKYAKNGKLLWVRTWTSAGSGRDYVEGVAADRQGNAWVAGHSEIAGGLSMATVSKWSSKGDRMFSDTVGLPTIPARFTAIAVDAGGNAYVGGSIDIGRVSGADMMVVKYAAAGTRSWLTRLEYGPEVDSALEVVLGDSTSVFVLGQLDDYRLAALAKLER